MIRQTDTHLFFYYGDDIYSNFYRANFLFGGVQCFCSEQAFMWAKAVFFRDWTVATDIAAVDPEPRNAAFTCKMLGREVKPYDDLVWRNARYDIMLDVLREKFRQNPELMEQLLATGDLILVEASQSDTIWGVGLAADHPDITNPSKWRGQNLLGKALMFIRDEERLLRKLP